MYNKPSMSFTRRRAYDLSITAEAITKTTLSLQTPRGKSQLTLNGQRSWWLTAAREGGKGIGAKTFLTFCLMKSERCSLNLRSSHSDGSQRITQMRLASAFECSRIQQHWMSGYDEGIAKNLTTTWWSESEFDTVPFYSSWSSFLRCSFFSLRVAVLKIKICSEANLRFLPNYTIMITYDQSLI